MWLWKGRSGFELAPNTLQISASKFAYRRFWTRWNSQIDRFCASQFGNVFGRALKKGHEQNEGKREDTHSLSLLKRERREKVLFIFWLSRCEGAPWDLQSYYWSLSGAITVIYGLNMSDWFINFSFSARVISTKELVQQITFVLFSSSFFFYWARQFPKRRNENSLDFCRLKIKYECVIETRT